MNIQSFKVSMVSIVALAAILWGYEAEAARGKKKMTSQVSHKKRARVDRDVSEDDQEGDENPSALKARRVTADNNEYADDPQPMEIENENNNEPEEDTHESLPHPKVPIFEQLTVKQQGDLIERSNAGDEKAQDEVASRNCYGMLPILKSSDVHFEYWSSLTKKAEIDDHYAFLVLRVAKSEDIKVKFPNLIPQLEKRAEDGIATSQLALGFAYRRGAGVPLDNEEGFKWVKMAALQGLANAQFIIGGAFLRSKGVN